MTLLTDQVASGTTIDVATPRSEVTLDPRAPLARIGALVDAGSFTPYGEPDSSGAFAGEGTIDGTPVVVYATDGSVQGGAMGTAGCARIAEAIEHAMLHGWPVVGIWHSGGARLQDGVGSLHAVGRVFAAMVAASGRVPQISLVMGPAAGGAAYGPALTDVVVMGPEGRVFVTGPDVVRKVTGEDVDAMGLGGPEPHGKHSGVVHVVAKTDAEAYARTRRLVTLLGARGRFSDAPVEPDHELGAILPDSPRRAYDVRPLVRQLLDDEPVELHKAWAPNIVTTLGRMHGRTVGVVANNPMRLAGCLDSASAEKAARFVRMCNAFGIPLVVLVDVPGYLPGVGQEWNGVVRRGAKLLHAFSEAVVPRVTLVTRKAYGGAYIAMNSSSLGATAVYAWPTAEVAVMSASAAVEVIHRREIAATPEAQRPHLVAKLAASLEEESGGLGKALELGVVDEVIEPADTKAAIVAALRSAPVRRGSHGNIPL